MSRQRSIDPQDWERELDVTIYKTDSAWGSNIWLHGREESTGKRVMMLLVGHRPYFYCEPGAEALEHSAVTEVEEGHVDLDGEPMVKVYVSHPGKVPKLRKLCEKPREADVFYLQRCVVDAGAWAKCKVKIAKDPSLPTGVYVTRPEWVEQQERRINPDLEILDLDIEGGNIYRVDEAPDEVMCIGIKDRARKEWHLWSYHPLHDCHIEEAETNKHGVVPVQHRHFTDEKGVEGEKAMFESFIDWLYRRKADVIATWYGSEFDIPYIINRTRRLGISSKRWGGHGKLDPKYVNIPGYQHLDLYKVHVRATYGGTQDDSLANIVSDVTEGEVVLDKTIGASARKWWNDDPKGLFEYNMRDVEATYLIDEVRRYSRIAAAAMFVTQAQGITDIYNISRLYDPMFLEEGRRRGVAMPHQFEGEDFDSGGGYVYPPTQGLHERVASFDWSSLYPTTIVTGNISYETLVDPETVNGDEPWLFSVPDLGGEEAKLDGPLYFDTREEGILPTIIVRNWDIKIEAGEMLAAAKTDEEKANAKVYYDMSKIILNGGYGIANSVSRIGCLELGEAVTAFSRYVTKVAGRYTEEELGRTVLYGDTDSIKPEVLDGDTTGTMKWMVSQIEEHCRAKAAERGATRTDLFKLEWEHLAEPLLVCKKKKYAYRMTWEDGKKRETPKIVIKGLWMVRRDCTTYTHDMTQDVLDLLLSEGADKDEVEAYVQAAYTKVRDGKVPYHQLGDRQAIKRDLMTYYKPHHKSGNLYWTNHVAHAAKACNDHLGTDWRAGDRPYCLPLEDAPDEYDAGYIVLDADDDIPDGFKPDWTHLANVNVATKLDSVLGAAGMADILKRLGNAKIDVEVEEKQMSEEERRRNEAIREMRKGSEETVTRATTVADFL